MDAKSILELIRTQRHDFINYLQVVLGYLQMNKVNEAKQYAAKVVLELTRFSKVTNLSFPEVALAFIAAQNEATQKALAITYDIQTDLRSCALSGQEISWCLEKALGQAIAYLSPLQVTDRNLAVNLQEEPERLACYITFNLQEQTERLEEEVEAMNSYLTVLRGRAEWQKHNAQGRMALFFPVK